MDAASHSIPELDAKGLRGFALQVGTVVAVLFGVFFPWLLDLAWPVWPWVLGGTLGLWGLVAPASLGPVYRGWMRFGLVLNRVVSPIVMSIIFFGLITPIALFMRVIRRDTMARRIDSDAQSYRVRSHKQPSDKMKRPF